MKVLVIGDIVGKPGREIVKQLLPAMINNYQVDFVIANGENAAGGAGITPIIAQELFASGINVLTSGNHIWDKKEIVPFITKEERLLRPANYPPDTPGKGWILVNADCGVTIGVANFAGRVFMADLDCPFRTADSLLPSLKQKTNIILVDFHAEATSEKEAFGWYLDGLVTAVFGTHTHVQTADERILPKGTAYITDIGMTGPTGSILGIEKEVVIHKFRSQMPVKFQVAKGPAQLNGIIIDIDETLGSSKSINRVVEFA
ncbi:MAG: TIGR00282 family metallophosphoesterase [bacterium]